MEHARKISKEQEQQLITMFNEGKTRKELAANFGLTLSGVQSVLWHNNIASRPRPQGRKPKFDVQDIIARYESGQTLQQIGTELGMNNTSVWAYLKRAGIQCRPMGYQKGDQHPGWVGGRITNSTGYVMVRIHVGDPFFSMAHKKVSGTYYVPEHRLVMAQKLGRVLEDYETVHHIDGDKLNNHPDNLQLRIGRHGKGAVYRCRCCGSYDVESVEIAEKNE